MDQRRAILAGEKPRAGGGGHRRGRFDDDARAVTGVLGGPTAGKGDLRRGMIKALSLRSSFWDWLYERALARAERPAMAMAF